MGSLWKGSMKLQPGHFGVAILFVFCCTITPTLSQPATRKAVLQIKQSLRKLFDAADALEVSVKQFSRDQRNLQQDDEDCDEACPTSRQAPLEEWQLLLERVSDVEAFHNISEAIANFTRIDPLSAVENVDKLSVEDARRSIRTMANGLTQQMEAMPNVLDETDVTANQLPFDLNILNQIYDLILRFTGINLRFVNTIIGNIIAAQALGIGPIISAVWTGLISISLAIIERLAWLVIQGGEVIIPGSDNCMTPAIECEMTQMANTLVPAMIRSAFVQMEPNSSSHPERW